MRILYVCTANICRSASAEQLLRDAIAAVPELSGVEVRSAGTHAVPGSPGCSVAPALQGHAQEHRAQPLTGELVEWADLILPAAHDHSRAIIRLAPAARTRTFTIRQAGRIADWLVESGMVVAASERAGGAAEGASADAAGWTDRYRPGDPRGEVAPLPESPSGRWTWLVTEMDAARGLAGASREPERAQVKSGRRLRFGRPSRANGPSAASQPLTGASGSTRPDSFDPGDSHPDDVPDPHLAGMGLHPLAFEQIAASTSALVRLLHEVAPRD